MAGSVDLIAQTFVLTSTSGSTYLVHWTGVTYFDRTSPVNLGGQTVTVQGVLSSGSLTASRIGAQGGGGGD